MKQFAFYRWIPVLWLGFALPFLCQTAFAQKKNKVAEIDSKAIFEFARQQYSRAVLNFTDTTRAIRTCDSTGKWTTIPKDDWMSGFFPGILWYIYEHTRDENLANQARKWTQSLERQKYLTKHHDIGFMMFCSFGNALRLKPQPTDIPILLQSAESAIKRFNPKTGTIKSWNFKPNDHPTIIDNMMNLELLTWASNQSGDPKYREIAIKHAETSIKNHFRPDFSSYHVVVYDSTTGQVIKKHTAQGYNDESRWARGQAWGLYGYTMMFRETGHTDFLTQACRISDLFIRLLPEDGVPFWDFDAPGIPHEVKDASSAAIAAAGLIELSLFAPEKKQRQRYFQAAKKMLAALSSPRYLARAPGYSCVLLHSAYHVPKKYEVDVNISYADYYYLEALSRLVKIEKGAKKLGWF
jgi:unsaturated chondroitin disaccharide hydrolase